jgi:hypothetical protein
VAAYEKRCIESIRHEYTLKSPAHWSEVEKAIGSASAEREAGRRAGFGTGDITITSENDELIIVSWVQERKI